MTDYLSPGVYIQEIEAPAPILGVSTSIAGFVGMAERGPVNVPILCTGPGDYTRWFGGLLYRQNFIDPTDPDRAHCYLPYAVAGFFNNNGQLAYVTRVVPGGATYATEQLFDRTGMATAPGPTILVRAAAQGDGAAGGNPLITLFPAPPQSTAAQPSWIRIGDGSAAEYGLVETVKTVTDAYPLDLPLQNFHASGPTGAHFLIYPANAAAGALTYMLAAAAPAGSVTILAQTLGGLTLTAAEIAAFAAATTIIQFATYDSTLVVAPTSITQTGASTFTIALATPLATGLTTYVNPVASPNLLATLITPLTAAALPAPATNILDAPASGGDIILYAEGAGFAVGALIDIDPGNPAIREIRTIAAENALTNFGFAQPNTIDWPAGTAVAPVAVAANSITALPLANVVGLNNVVGMIAGSVLLLNGVDYVTLASVNGASNQVTLTAPAPAGLAVGNSALLVSTSTLSAAVAGGAQQIALTGRSGVNAGTILRIGSATIQEYAVVLSAPGVRALGADPGLVVLDAPLVNGYASGAAVAVVNLAPPPTVTGAPAATTPRAAQLVLDMPAGSTGGYVTWRLGWPATTQLVQITLADGAVCYNSIGAAGAPTAEQLDAVVLANPLQSSQPLGATIVSRNPLILIQALDKGSWGNRVVVSVQDESPGLVSSAGIVASLAGGTQLKISSLTGVQPGSYLEMVFTATGALVDSNTPLKVASVNVATSIVTLDNPISAPQLNAINNQGNAAIFLRSREFRITVTLQQQPNAALPALNTQIIQTETFRNLSMDPRHNQYFQTIIGAINGPPRLSDNRPQGASWLIRTQDIGVAPATMAPRLGPEAMIDILPSGLQRPAQFNLESGDDGVTSLKPTTVADQLYVGADADKPTGRSGIYALLNVPQISIVAVPGQGTPAVQAALIAHCENALYRFAILDPQYPDSAIADIQNQRQNFDTKFAALYYPWLTIPDPNPVNLNNIQDFALPPCGHVAGIYAQVDDARGVFKAPANVAVQGITGLTATLAKGDQDVLNPYPTNINVIRDFRQSGRGIRVWGARIITSDANYTYVPVKRLLMFIEESLDVGLQDIVFEPNAPPLWASVERLIGNFLTIVWNAGGLQGNTANESFFVRCDLTTMTQDDIDAGRLIAQVGVAPVYPAEFIIIQISLTIPATSN